MLIECANRPVLLQQRRRRLCPNTRHTRDVVRRIALQRLQIRYLLRRKPVLLLNGVRVKQRLITRPTLIKDADRRRNQLHRVLIPGDDDGPQALLRRPLGKVAQNVIRLEALQLDDRQPDRLHGLTDAPELRAHLIRHVWPLRLVLLVHLMAECRAGHIKRHCGIRGSHLPQHLKERGGHAEHRIRRLS